MNIKNTVAEATLNEQIPDVVELATKLVQIDSQNPGVLEHSIANYILELLQSCGLQPEIYYSSTGRPNIYCKKAASSSKRIAGLRSLLLQGHMDTVTADKDEWLHDPHSGHIEDGYLWGRGALDMKSGLAMMIRSFIEVSSLDLPFDLVLMCFSDEERGGVEGAKYMVKNHSELFIDIDFALGEFGGFPLYFGDKKLFMIQVDEKRPLKLELAIKGESGHGSLARNDLFLTLSGVLKALSEYESPIKVTSTASLTLKTIFNGLGYLGQAIAYLLKFKILEKVIAAAAIKVTKGLLKPMLTNMYTPISVQSSGGYNVSASSATISLDARVLPNIDNDTIFAELRTMLGKFSKSVDIKLIEDNVDVKSYLTDMSLYSILKDVLLAHEPNANVAPLMLPASTDAKHLRELGIQTYGFIPINSEKGFNFMDLIHSKNERIPIDSIRFGYQCLLGLIHKLSNQKVL
jgi:acetylornithine deacetylase/succinyl-diaminopimelate desuccinylase-like protein